MTFERTTDAELIKKIFLHPKIWPYVGDDYAPDPKNWEPPINDNVIYILVKDGSEDLGLVIFHPENAVCWESHICMLPIAYGEKTKLAVLGSLRWMWDNTKCQRIIGRIPVFNTLAIACAINTGFTKFGLNPASFMKDGKLHDMVLVGVSKE